jgi:hypothetical protein
LVGNGLFSWLTAGCCLSICLINNLEKILVLAMTIAKTMIAIIAAKIINIFLIIFGSISFNNI